MRTIAVAIQKGGCGKTSSVLALGDGLARRGLRILYVDLDAQANLSYVLKGGSEAGNVLDALQHPRKAAAAVQDIEGGGLLASSPALAGADTFLTEIGKEYRLREALSSIEDAGSFDICLLDAPPSLGILTVNALTAAEAVIVPAQADIFSLQGLRQLSTTIDAVRAYTNKALSLTGLLVTRLNARAVIRKDITEMLAQAAHDMGTTLFKTRIRECTALVEAQALRQSIFSYAPKSNAAQDYGAFVDEVAGRLGLG